MANSEPQEQNSSFLYDIPHKLSADTVTSDNWN